MKNIIFKTTALTLIELIVSSMLVSVVLFGLFSVTSVLSTNSQDYGQKYLLASQTQATLNHILGNAALAVRDNISSQDPGILIPVPGDPNSFCIHQDINPGLSPASTVSNNTPGVYTDDRWLCYTLSNNQIYYCAMAYVPGGSPWGAASCVPANSVFLGTAYGISAPIITDPPAPVSSPSYTNPTFSIIIQNCLNDSAATCVPDCYFSNAGNCVNGGTTDPVNNPEVVRSGSAATSQVSP